MLHYRLIILLSGLGVCSSMLSQTCDSIPILKIGLIADPQYCDCDPGWNTRYYRETLKKLPKAIDTLNRHKVDFVMNLGDMIDRYETSYDSVVQFYQELEAPYYNLLGNHEFEEVSEGYMSTMLERYEMPAYYYDFSYGDWRFIVLDGTELASYSRFLHPELAAEGDSLWQSVQGNINAYPWNGGISRTQQVWIRSKLDAALNSEQNVILFCHFPVYPDTLQNALFNSTAIMELLESYPNVTAYIGGHQHEGSYGYKNGIHYLTQKAMVDTPDKNSFAILEIYTSEIRLKGYGNNEDVVLPYENIKKKELTFELTDTVLHYSDHLNSYIGKIVPQTAGDYPIDYSLLPLAYQNEYFVIRHDSLFLHSEEDLSSLDVIRIEVLASSCTIDSTVRNVDLKFDTSVVHFNVELSDTVISIYDTYQIPLNSIMNDYSRFGLDHDLSIEDPLVCSQAEMNSGIILTPLRVGATSIELIVTDTYTGKQYIERFRLTVSDPLNHIPYENTLVPKSYFVLLADTLGIDLNVLFTDADNDDLVFKYSNMDTAPSFTSWLVNNYLYVSATDTGQAIYLVEANDGRGGTVSVSIDLRVNRMPVRNNENTEYIFQYNTGCTEVDLDSIFSDPDNDTLSFVIPDSDFNTKLTDASLIEICPYFSGSGCVQLTINDGKNGILNDSIQLRFNGAPEANYAEYFLGYTLDNETVSIDLDTVFFDVDNTSLSYSITYISSATLTYYLDGSSLDVTPGDTIPAYLDVIADDSSGGYASARIDLVYLGYNVNQRNEEFASPPIVYPNPSGGRIILMTDGHAHGTVEIRICDIYGRIVFIKNVDSGNSSTLELDVSEMKLKGMYFLNLRLTDGSEISSRIFIK